MYIYEERRNIKRNIVKGRVGKEKRSAAATVTKKKKKN